MKSSANHILELDGVRGTAMMIILVYHAFMFGIGPPEGLATKLLSYGIASVDLFFVLSGFLITNILLNVKGKPRYFRDFYSKRALRIWPLYFALLLVSFGLGPTLIRLAHLPLAESISEIARLESKSKLVYVFMLQNLWYYGVAPPAFLSVTWSLAIEEQFYIAWPWMVLFFSRKSLVRILVAILVLSPCVRLLALLHGVSPLAVYFKTCYRLDALSVGALIALWYQSDWFSLARAKWASLAAMAIGVPGLMWLLDHNSWPLLYSMCALSSGGIVTFAIWSSKTDSIFGAPLRAAWLRYVGKVSYCLYLIHQPIYYVLGFKFRKHHIYGGWGGAIICLLLGFAVGLIIASLSWYLFESQILKLKGKLVFHQRKEAPAVAV